MKKHASGNADDWLEENKISRRTFLKALGVGAGSLSVYSLTGFNIPNAFGAKGDRFMIAAPSEMNTFDPMATADVGRAFYRLNFFDGLTRWRDVPPKIEPWLADSWKISSDGLKWTYHIRKDAKFHDGSKVTAEDVVYSTERLLALGTGAASLIKRAIEPGSTRALDKSTVEFNLSSPYAPFESLLHSLHILNKKVLQAHEKNGDWGKEWLSTNGTRLGEGGVGSGSYTVKMYDPATGIDGDKFDDHFYPWKPSNVEKIGYRTYSETASRLLALKKGEIHASLGGYLPWEQLEDLKRSPQIDIISKPSLRLFYSDLNNQKPPTNDVHIRRAICYAFDYDSWIRDVKHNTAERNIGPIPNPMWGSLDAKTDFGYKYDLDKAKYELKQAELDIKNYEPVEIGSFAGYPACQEAALLMQDGLRKIGVKSTIVQKTWPQFVELQKNKETAVTMAFHWRSAYYPDPHNWVGEMFGSDKWGTWGAGCYYKNPQVDELLHKALVSSNREEREELYKKAGRQVVQDAAAIFVHNENWYAPVNTAVKNIRFCPIGNGNELRWVCWRT